MESRKRPHTDDGDVASAAKKRVLASSNGTPHVNGVNDQTEDEHVFDAGLETFRKEAIYRRMKHYCRENERNLARIEDLERRRTTCEAGLAAMSACWAQLIETVRLLVNPDNMPEVGIKGKDIFKISSSLGEKSIPDLKNAMGEAAQATEALVTRLVKSGADDRSQVLQSKSYQECQKAQTECTALRSELQHTQQRLHECQEMQEKYRHDLETAQNRAERSQSLSVLALESRQPVSKASSINGDAEDAQRKPPSPSDSPVPSATAPPAQSSGLLGIPETLQARESRIKDLERQCESYRRQLMEVEASRATQLQVEQIETHPMYVELQEQMMEAIRRAVNLETELKPFKEESHKTRTSRNEWQSEITRALSDTVQELKSQISKRDAENTRLREQRDQQAAEINERKHKESIKMASLNEWKTLAESRGERINILRSEVRRCKARLAANEVREDLMLFFAEGNEDLAKCIEDLKDQKAQTEARLVVLKKALGTGNGDDPGHSARIEAQAEVEQQLAKVSSELAEFKKVFGDLSILPPETSELVMRLQTQTTELERSRLLNVQHQQEESVLYDELEKLSTAWEGLDKQLANKVFDLSSMEERLQKSVIEKAKSDNKFFSAMRDKEAIDGERKSLHRVLEKQGKALDRCAELEKALQTQNLKLESTLTLLEKERDQLLEKYSNQRLVALNLKQTNQKYFTEITETKASLNKREADLSQQFQALRRTEELCNHDREVARRAAQQAKEEAAALIVSKHGSGTKDDAEYQHLRSLLLCSTCGNNFRSVVITKCMHTFCKPCVDARITTRQRKCPACNLQFGQADVSTLYMQ